MELPRSAVAVVEMAEHFVVQRRPNLPGELAYPGMLQLLGGSANPGESLAEAVLRELGEETTLNTNHLVAEPEWEGPYTSEDKAGKPLERYVGLFRVAVAEPFTLTEQGELVHVGKTPEAVDAIAIEATPFAHWALMRVYRNRR